MVMPVMPVMQAFKLNSLEQLFINYCNERLHQLPVMQWTNNICRELEPANERQHTHTHTHTYMQ